MDKTQQVIRRVIWGLVVAVLVYGAMGLWADASQVWRALGQVPLWVWAAAFGLSVVNYAMRFGKWQWYLHALDLAPTRRLLWWESLLIFLSGLMMSITPGKLGEVFKSYLLRHSHGVEMARTAPIVVAERLTDVIALLVLSSLGLLLFDYGRWAFVICVVGVVMGIVVLTQRRMMLWLVGQMQRVGRLAPIAERVEVAYDAMRRLLTLPILASTSMMSVVSWAMEALAFYLLLWQVQALDLTWAKVSFLYAMSTLIGAISFLPGGLGVTEAGMIGGLKTLGLLNDTAMATAVTAAIRLTTLWFGVACGAISLGFYRRLVQRDAQA